MTAGISSESKMLNYRCYILHYLIGRVNGARALCDMFSRCVSVCRRQHRHTMSMYACNSICAHRRRGYRVRPHNKTMFNVCRPLVSHNPGQRHTSANAGILSNVRNCLCVRGLSRNLSLHLLCTQTHASTRTSATAVKQSVPISLGGAR